MAGMRVERDGMLWRPCGLRGWHPGPHGAHGSSQGAPGVRLCAPSESSSANRAWHRAPSRASRSGRLLMWGRHTMLPTPRMARNSTELLPARQASLPRFMTDSKKDKGSGSLPNMPDLSAAQALGDQPGLGSGLGGPPRGPSPAVSASATPRTGSMGTALDYPSLGSQVSVSPAPRPPQSPGAYAGVRRASPGPGSAQVGETGGEERDVCERHDGRVHLKTWGR